MKLIIMLASLLFLNSSSLPGQDRNDNRSAQSVPQVLRISVIPTKTQYRTSEHIKFHVIVENLRHEEIYILNTLWFGHFGSMDLHVLDASSREIPPIGPSHAMVTERPVEPSRIVRLEYDHFLGTEFVSPLSLLNVRRPGKYGVYVEYLSPVNETEVSVKPFWGREKGPIRSPVVWIEVRP